MIPRNWLGARPWITDAGRRALATDNQGRLDVTRYCQLLDLAHSPEPKDNHS